MVGRRFTSVELSWTSGATPGGIWYGAGKRLGGAVEPSRPASRDGQKRSLRLVLAQLTHMSVDIVNQGLGQLRSRQMKGRGMVEWQT